MQLVAGQLNNTLIENIIRQHIDDCNEVIAIVPYCSSTKLFELCLGSGKKLTYFGRLDQGIPVTSKALKWFLNQQSPNYSCLLINGILHAKIIWLKGEGVYIGSANLTDNGWMSNIEAGAFLTDEDLRTHNMEDELLNLVDEVRKRSTPLTREIYDFVVELEKRDKEGAAERSKVSKWFKKNCKVGKASSLASVNKKKAAEQRRIEFLKEWNNTLELLRTIAARLRDYRPDWIASSVPDGVHVDQFLHAYYYLQVRKGSSQPYEEHFAINQHDPEVVLIEQMQWWQTGDYDHESESEFIHEWAPSSRKLLAKDKITSLTEDEFAQLCTQVHAIRDHAVKQSNVFVGLSGNKASKLEKTDAFGRWLYKHTSSDGKSVLETIHYVLYGGDATSIPERLLSATKDDKWRIAHFGLNSLGEIVGWAMPDTFPPRNTRTSKALRALGNDVEVH